MPAQVFINGEPFNLLDAQNLQELLDQFGAKQPYVVALNMELVPHSGYANQSVKAGDRIDVLQPIQGG